MVENWNNKGGFMPSNKEWLFSDFNISPHSILGVSLAYEIKKIDDSDLGDEEKKRVALENLGKTVGCEIRANDFMALGPKQYFEIRNDVKTAIVERINRLTKKPEN